MHFPYNLQLASAESVATASTTEGISQLGKLKCKSDVWFLSSNVLGSDFERVASPPFNVRIYQRKSSEGSAISLGHPTVSVFNN